MSAHPYIVRRDTMEKLLSELEAKTKENPENENVKLDKQVTKLLKTINGGDFREPPDHSWLAEFPNWTTVCIACRYANITGWDMPPSRIIQGYLPNNDKAWLSDFRSKWDGLRVLYTTSGEDLLNLLKAPTKTFDTLRF